jgi:beta-N-acetylhexosaminidase
MTDDLDMGAVAKNYDISTAVSQALKAEVDLLLICHKGPAIASAFEEILAFNAARGSRRENAERSLERILALKRKYLALHAAPSSKLKAES